MPNPNKEPETLENIDKWWSLWTDKTRADIHVKLRSLRVEEFKSIAADEDNIESAVIAATGKFLRRAYTETGRYLSFVINTWSGLAIVFVWGGVSWFDLFTMLVYAVGGTVVLGVVLVFCLLFTTTPVKWAFQLWTNKYGGGYSLVNNTNPRVFQTLTEEQFDAAVEALRRPVDQTRDELEPQAGREFNLDIAKLLIRLAAVVYEYKNEELRGIIQKSVEQSKKNPFVLPLSKLALLSNPTAPPTQISAWKRWLFFWTVPGDARKYMDLSEEAIRNAPLNVNTAPLEQASEKHGDDLGAKTIREFCQRFDYEDKDKVKQHGLEYETISHLGDTSSAVSGLFWRPGENWIVVVFKGTSPLEYGEWLSNLNTKLSPVGSHVSGFKRMHKGFKERVFPEDASRIKLGYGTTPYDTIALGIQTLAKWLYINLPNDPKFQSLEGKPKINVWFTGHSLGCATATLVYAKLLNAREKHISLRDAYLFAAPIVCDRDSVESFNAKMLDENRHPRTMWRITSGKDFVATCLPELGDYTDLVVSPNNAFAFAHLGTEIILRDGPRVSYVAGNHLPWGSTVKITSKFSPSKLLEQYREALLKKNTLTQPAKDGKPAVKYEGADKDQLDATEINRIWWASLAQQIPFFIGRLIAHGTVNYIDQLDRIALGECEWTSNWN